MLGIKLSEFDPWNSPSYLAKHIAMEDHGCNKVSGMRQIVRLKEILQKWQSATLSPKGDNSVHPNITPGGISPAVNMRLRNSNVASDDEDGSHSPEPPPDVPKGYLAVYVGPELRRFIIPTGYLTHPLFKVLLKKVEEEFGFDHSGGLTIPCEIETFKYLLKCIESHPEAHPDENNTCKLFLFFFLIQ